jgi:hypothetical protein
LITQISIGSGFRFVQKVVRFLFIYFYDILIVTFWLIFSNVVKRFIKFDRVSDKLIFNSFSNIYFWRCQEYTNLLIPNKLFTYQQTYIGNNVNDLLFDWISLDLDLTPNAISYSQILDLSDVNQNSIVVTAISNNLKDLRFFVYVCRIYIYAKKLRKLGIPVVCFLPDSFFADAAIISVILTSLTRGTVIMPQNTKEELIRFGFPRVGQSLFWTYPKSRRKKLMPDQNTQKKNVILVAKNSSGGSRRDLLISAVSSNFEANGYRVVETNGSYSQDEYENLVKISKFIATTNYVQDGFFYGPKSYQKRISLETITGRTWDAFASRSLLITNPTGALTALGFHVGLHYLDINLFSGSEIIEIPPDDMVSEITQRSFDLFLKLGNNKKFV